MKNLKYLVGGIIIYLIINYFIVDFTIDNLSKRTLFVSGIYLVFLISFYLFDNCVDSLVKRVYKKSSKVYLRLVSFVFLVLSIFFFQKLMNHFFDDEVLPSYFLYCFPVILFLDALSKDK